MISNTSEVIAMINKKYPLMMINNITNAKDYFIVSLIPKDYSPIFGIWLDGLKKVDKKTGKISAFNPLTDKLGENSK